MNFAYINAQTRVRPDQLHTSEYYGEGFAEGKMSAILFEMEDGSRVIVWSAGDWRGFDVQEGSFVSFTHTQNHRTYYGEILHYLDGKTIPEGVQKRKYSEWTLK